MKSRPTTSRLFLAAVFQAALSSAAVATTNVEAAGSMRIDPSVVRVDMFYSGATVHVGGTIPADYDAAVLCSGAEDSVELKKKGKVLGILWMSVGEFVLDSAPSLYLLSTSVPLSDLAPRPALDALGLGYPALASRVAPSIEQTESDGSFAEFLKLKEHEDLYSYDPGGVKLEPLPGGAARISARCLLPTKAPWGEYEVRLFGFSAGKGELLGTERLEVRPVGMTARISALAQDHGLLYGTLAVVIALGVGLLTGLAFGLTSKKGN